MIRKKCPFQKENITMEHLNRELLRTLSRNDAIFDRCCGPNGNGLDFDSLLTALQAEYPATGWTIELLSDLLLNGQHEGRIKQIPENVFYLYNAMILVNIRNKVYQNTSAAICPCPSSCGCRGVNSTLV
jgi:hypothetical protein